MVTLYGFLEAESYIRCYKIIVSYYHNKKEYHFWHVIFKIWNFPFNPLYSDGFLNLI